MTAIPTTTGAPPDGARRPALPAALLRPVAVMAGLATLLLVALAFLVAGATVGTVPDVRAAELAAAADPNDPLLLAIDHVGEPVGALVAVGALAALCAAAGRWRLGVAVCGALALAGIAVAVLKPVVGRTINGGFLAYPSGHTATATVIGTALALLVVDVARAGRGRALLGVATGALLAGGAMAVAQVALGAHYATDTVGGFALGFVLVVLVAHLVDRATRAGRTPEDS